MWQSSSPFLCLSPVNVGAGLSIQLIQIYVLTSVFINVTGTDTLLVTIIS
jgi:hypothetical protein